MGILASQTASITQQHGPLYIEDLTDNPHRAQHTTNTPLSTVNTRKRPWREIAARLRGFLSHNTVCDWLLPTARVHHWGGFSGQTGFMLRWLSCDAPIRLRGLTSTTVERATSKSTKPPAPTDSCLWGNAATQTDGGRET